MTHAANHASNSSSSNTPATAPAAAASNSPSAPQSPECLSCVRLLQHVLSNSESKPSRLLQSMMAPTNTSSIQNNALQFQATPDGVRVPIPAEQSATGTATAHHREEAAAPPTLSPTTTLVSEPLLRRLTRMGWSATTTTTTTDDDTAVQSSFETSVVPLLATSTTQPTEWMSLQCRTCSDTGPEGNARAFVMGPTPLSIVVCHNRLVSSSSSAAAGVAEMQEILTHELTHVYDVRRLHLDLRSCRDLAYSEVRAARAAECAHVSRGATLFGPSRNGQKDCVAATAMTATRNLFARQQAQECVQSVLEEAYADHRPLDSGSTAAPATKRVSAAPRRPTPVGGSPLNSSER